MQLESAFVVCVMFTTQKLLEIVEILQLDLLTKVKVAVCVLVLTVTIIVGATHLPAGRILASPLLFVMRFCQDIVLGQKTEIQTILVLETEMSNIGVALPIGSLKVVECEEEFWK